MELHYKNILRNTEEYVNVDTVQKTGMQYLMAEAWGGGLVVAKRRGGC
jgi:hypothetical protein